MNLIEQQHQTETGELTRLLKLQQDEELEKIRKVKYFPDKKKT